MPRRPSQSEINGDGEEEAAPTGISVGDKKLVSEARLEQSVTGPAPELVEEHRERSSVQLAKSHCYRRHTAAAAPLKLVE